MGRKRIVTGQHVEIEKAERAQQFRREMTPAEVLLWQRLRAGRLGGLHFRRQQIIAGFIVDFYCHAAALVIEVDGGVHQHQRTADAERDHIIEAHGLAILRFANEEVEHKLDDALDRIRRAALSRIAAFETE